MNDFETMKVLFQKSGIEFSACDRVIRYSGGRLFHHTIELGVGRSFMVVFGFDELKNMIGHVCTER